MTVVCDEHQRANCRECCTHGVLDERGRCKACGEWAVLTGQVPAPKITANPRRTRE